VRKFVFPISRDPPEGGTVPSPRRFRQSIGGFPISRDPPEGGTLTSQMVPKPQQLSVGFQFLGIPPKGERWLVLEESHEDIVFPISRDPPEGGTFFLIPKGR